MAAHKEADVFAVALALSTSERARLAHQLLRSLDQVDGSDDSAWREEIERRAREVDAGTVELREWTTVKQELTERWRKP
jgi:putative addiction module component (TIGR02574 family)